jgi:hypothetical protein
MDPVATHRTSLRRIEPIRLQRFRFFAAPVQTSLSTGDRRHRRPTDAESARDLPLRQLPFRQLAGNFLDQGYREHRKSSQTNRGMFRGPFSGPLSRQ